MKSKTLLISLLSLVIASCTQANSTNTEETTNSHLVANPVMAQVDNTQTANAIQIALILDTSNSMDGLIDQAKRQLWNIVNELARASKDSNDANVSIALYEYGNDNISVRDDYIRQVLPFTTDLDDISEKLFALRTNGGSEYCGAAIHTSLKDLSWSEDDGAMKVIYIAGNEPFTQGGFSHKEACEMASQRNVTVYPIFCGDMEEGRRTNWSDCAVMTQGKYMNIDSDIKVVEVATPYDDSLDVLNFQLNNTYIHYGTNGRAFKEKQERQDNNHEGFSKANKINRTMSKSSKLYNNGNWDLVDAYKKDTTVVTKINKETLPVSLQTLSDTELKQKVYETNNKREKIKQKIAEIGKDRAKYIADNKSDETENTLGENMIKSIKVQAEKKGYTFN